MNKSSVLPQREFSLKAFFQNQTSSAFLKQKLIQNIPEQEDNANQDTNTCLKGPMPSKIRLEADEAPTLTRSIIKKEIQKGSNQTNKLENRQLINQVSTKAKEDSSSSYSLRIDIPTNKKVEEIMKRPSMRQRFSVLLPDSLKLPIGYQHQKLLKLLGTIDQTIQFLTSNRMLKFIFYEDLRKNIMESLRMIVTLGQIQQLLFINDSLFDIEWQKNQKIRKFDILIKMPKVDSHDARIDQTRSKLIKYLLAKEAESLGNQNTQSRPYEKWSQGFDPSRVEIPLKNLPIHPFNKEAELRQMSNLAIDSVKNQKLKYIMKHHKEQSDAKSLSSVEVANMIFSKNSSSNIRDRIYGAIQEREKYMNEKMLTAAPQVSFDKESLLQCCDEILLIFMSKGVNNMFKVTLLDQLKKRLRYKDEQIESCLQELMKMQAIGFIKQSTTSSKAVIIQINKSRLNDTLSYIRQRL